MNTIGNNFQVITQIPFLEIVLCCAGHAYSSQHQHPWEWVLTPGLSLLIPLRAGSLLCHFLWIKLPPQPLFLIPLWLSIGHLPVSYLQGGHKNDFWIPSRIGKSHSVRNSPNIQRAPKMLWEAGKKGYPNRRKFKLRKSINIILLWILLWD